jgi:gamma-glutamylaminecyclotransferase
MADRVKEVPLIENKPTILVGTYGTLKKGFSRHDKLGMTALYVGAFPVPGLLFHAGDYPQLVKPPEKPTWRETVPSVVMIEVYRTMAQQITILDAIEGHPNLFRREQVDNALFGTEKVWIYYWAWPREKFLGKQKIITSNVWRGPETPCIEVDFGDGTKKPHIVSKKHIFASDIKKPDNTAEISGVVIDASTGEIQELDLPHVDNLPVIMPPAPSSSFTPGRYPGLTASSQKTRWDPSTGVMRDTTTGEELEWCFATSKYVPKADAKTKEEMEAAEFEKLKEKLKPSSIVVPKGSKLEDAFPKVSEL